MPQIKLNEVEEKIITTLLKHPEGCRITEILKDANLSKTTFMRHVKRLIEIGLVTKEVRVNEGYPPPVYYKLAEVRTDEINAYLEHVKETTINNLNLILKAIKLDEETKKKLEEAYEALKARKRD